jgi:hypothetical protein
MLRFRVDPPTVRRPPHGLLDVAEVVERDDPHWRTGIEYDSYACSTSKLWGRWCTAAGLPSVPPDAVEVTITLTGALAAETYSLTAEATSTSFVRQLIYTYYDSGIPAETHATTVPGAVTIAESDEPLDGHLVITDVLTGTSIDYNLVQNADTGALEHPQSPIVFAVPVAAVPEGCEQITTTFTASAALDPATGVAIAVASVGAIAGERVVTVAGHRLVLAAGEATGSITISEGVGEGTWPISIRDVASESFVSGWLYIGDDLAGEATLVQATCPVKEIRSAPWQTLFAPAWTVYSEVECQSMAFDDAAEAASDALEISKGKAIEAAWWDLAAARARQIGSGLSLIRAIAELEHYIATNYNGLGIIHAPVYLAAWLGLDLGAGYDRVPGSETERLMQTLRGTPVVLGAGYPRQDDPDLDGAQVALMATGAVRLYVSGVAVVETFDRRTNLRSAVAEQTVAAADDCLEPAVVYVDVGVER